MSLAEVSCSDGSVRAVEGSVSQKDSLLYDLRIVSSNRFNYSKRMYLKARWKTYVQNFISLITIVISFYLISAPAGLDAQVVKYLGASIAAVSLWALYLSLETPSAQLATLASEAHRCGREINAIRYKLKHGVVDVSEAVAQYAAALDAFDINHDEIDYLKTLYENRFKYPEKAVGGGYFWWRVAYVFSVISVALQTIVALGVFLGLCMWIL